MDNIVLEHFLFMDDFDFMHAIKVWSRHNDMVLSNALQRPVKPQTV